MTTRALQFDMLLAGLTDDDGDPLASGTVTFYAAGTSTLKNVYTDKAKTAPYTTRTLDSSGRVHVYGDGLYKIVIKDSSGTTYKTYDNVYVRAANFYSRTVTGDTTATIDDDFIMCNTDGGAITVTLMEIADGGVSHPLIIKRNGSNNVTIDGGASETIGGSATYVMSVDNRSIELISDGTNWQISGSPATSEWDRGTFNRATFSYNATAYTIKVKPGNYFVKDKPAHWVSELTTNTITADIGEAPAADTWYYLYIDHSAVTSGTDITNSELVWSADEPSYNTTYRQWLRTTTNTDDRCIFAVLTNGTPDGIVPFYHDGGDLLSWADQTGVISSSATATTWNTNVDCSGVMPVFSQKIEASAYVDAVTSDGVLYFYWSTDSTVGTTGHIFLVHERIGTDQFAATSGLTIMTDADQTFDWKRARGVADVLTVLVNGWYFSTGL